MKWAGGKGWLVEAMRHIYEPYRHLMLCEPFAGGAAVTFGLLPNSAELCDINGELINFYQVLQRGRLHDIPDGAEWPANDPETFAAMRLAFNIYRGRLGSSQARRFYYLNRTCFNGLSRYNRKGEFNVPWGKYKSPTLIDREEAEKYRSRMRCWTFIQADFGDRFALGGKSQFVFADPPYDAEGGEFTAYDRQPFGWDLQQQLASLLSRHKGPVVTTNAATGRILGMYTELGFDIHLIDEPRRIACNGDRTPARCMLATKNLPHDLVVAGLTRLKGRAK